MGSLQSKMGFDRGPFTVSRLPPGVKHTEEALRYVRKEGMESRPHTAPVNFGGRKSSGANGAKPASRAAYNTNCNLYM